MRRLFSLLVGLFFFVVTTATACEYFPTYRKIGANIRLRVVSGGMALPNAKAKIERSIVPGGPVPIEEFVRQGNADGVIVISDLVPGDFYSIWVFDEQGNVGEWLHFEIMPAKTGEFTEVKATFPVRPETSPLKAFKGTVLFRNGRAIPNLSIVVRNKVGDPIALAIVKTGPDGLFFSTLPDGEYNVSFEGPGFNPARLPLIVQSNGSNAWRGTPAHADPE